VAGKETIGLASHWPCGTDFSGLSTYGLTAKVREMSTPPAPIRAWSTLPFLPPVILRVLMRQAKTLHLACVVCILCSLSLLGLTQYCNGIIYHHVCYVYLVITVSIL